MVALPSLETNIHLANNLKQVSVNPEQLDKLCREHPIRKLSLFGSILRADFTGSSDVDFLVEFNPEAKIGYFKLVQMEQELTELVGRKADLRTPGELSHYFRQNVLNEAIALYVKD